MAAALVGAIAADREIRRLRQRGEQVEQMPRFRPLHLTTIAADELLPALGIIQRRLRALEQCLAWRDVGQPDVVEVARCSLGLRDAARRPTYGAETEALVAGARAAKSNDANGHDYLTVFRSLVNEAT